MYQGEGVQVPILIKSVKNPDWYYTNFAGSALTFTIYEETKDSFNVVARGMGVSWSENYQKTPIMEWGKRHCVEIVTGAMPVGQLSIQSMFFMQLNDALPTYKNLTSNRELNAFIQIGANEDPAIAGLVLDVFQGVHIVGQQGNWNAQSLYLRNANMMYRTRLTGLEWALKKNSTLYPATGEKAVTEENATNGE